MLTGDLVGLVVQVASVGVGRVGNFFVGPVGVEEGNGFVELGFHVLGLFVWEQGSTIFFLNFFEKKNSMFFKIVNPHQ